MNSYNTQLRTLLHSYELNNSHVVYNLHDSCFYTVGSTSSLNKEEYEIKSTDVSARIETFIQENREYLDHQLLTQFSERLRARICKLEAKTTSLWALFYYVFNPERKAKLKQDKCLAESMKKTVDIALTQLLHYQEEEVIDEEETRNLVEKSSSKTPLKSQTEVPLPRSPLKSFTPNKQSGTPHKTPLSKPTPLKPPPVLTTPKIQAVILPGEPPALPFDPVKYTKLPAEELVNQVEAIDTYIAKVKIALEPVEKIVKHYSHVQESIQTNQKLLSEVEQQLKQCEANLKYLKEQEKSRVIFLEFKRGKDFIQLPFFSDEFQQEVLEKNQLLEQERARKKQDLTHQTADQKQILEQYKINLAALGLDQKEDREKLHIQIQEVEKTLHSLEEQIEELNRQPSLEKKVFYSALKLSEAMERFENFISNQQDRIQTLKEELQQLEEERDQLKQSHYQNMDLPTLEELLEKKVTQLDRLMRNKASRKQLIKQKTEGKTVVQPKDVTRQPEVVDEFPELQPLLNLPQDVLVLLRGERMRANEQVEDFRASVYGQIYTPSHKSNTE